MSDQNKQAMIQAVKDAIMVEIKGQQLYHHAASQTEDAAAKAMFEMLAKDEDDHVRILQNQYKSLMEEGRINLEEVHPAEVDHGSHNIINDVRKYVLGNLTSLQVLDMSNNDLANDKLRADRYANIL